ncbi:MAG: sodium:proton antiporter NhaD [Rikenellaceae bacterium]
MEILLVIIFLLGYIAIALEHSLKINKAATALVVGVVLWVVYAIFAPELAIELSGEEFEAFVNDNSAIASLPLVSQAVKFIVEVQIIEHLGEISETLFFLLGAMTIVEMIDVHGGFAIITNRITTNSKIKLIWIVSLITFILSALLDNMTTAIVMIMLVRRLIINYKERWVFGSIIIIAANSGGAFSPIGDITTIMLWVKGNVTAQGIIPALFFPSLVACLIPTWIASHFLHGMIMRGEGNQGRNLTIQKEFVTRKESLHLLIVGVGCLVSVPIFKSLTHLPPFMGILLSLGIIWSYTEIMYAKKVGVDESLKHRVPRVLRRVDTPTILFFLGILMAVAALQSTGVLAHLSSFLDEKIHNVYVTNIMIGILSSIVDNVPLVAASSAMYPTVDPAMLATSADAIYMANFVVDGVFWQFLAYCAGVGGSILIIGSVSGVVIMGIEKISFGWYVKNISLMAFTGYIAGAGVFILQNYLLSL